MLHKNFAFVTFLVTFKCLYLPIYRACNTEWRDQSLVLNSRCHSKKPFYYKLKTEELKHKVSEFEKEKRKKDWS